MKFYKVTSLLSQVPVLWPRMRIIDIICRDEPTATVEPRAMTDEFNVIPAAWWKIYTGVEPHWLQIGQFHLYYNNKLFCFRKYEQDKFKKKLISESIFKLIQAALSKELSH